MIQLSSLLKKPVISVSTSDVCGEIKDVYFDKMCKKIAYFYIENAQALSCFLPFESAQYISDAIVIEDKIQLIPTADIDLTELCANMYGKPVYTLNGIFKGMTTDVIAYETGKVSKLQTQDEDIIPSSVASIGDVIFIKSTAKPSQKQKKNKIPKPEKDYPVYILEETENKEINNAPQAGTPVILHTPVAVNAAIDVNAEFQTPQPPVSLTSDVREPVLSHGAFELLLDGSAAYSYDEDAHTPTRVICDYEFLLGRTLGADLCTYTGELIAKKDSAVTGAIVEKARRAGKLVELTLNSVKPAIRHKI